MSTTPVIIVIAESGDTIETHRNKHDDRYVSVTVRNDRHAAVAHLDLSADRARDLLTQLTEALAVTA